MLTRKGFIQHTLAGVFGLIMPDLNFAKPNLSNSSASSRLINAGIAGNTTRNLLVRVKKDCLAHHPDLTIMMVGTNDMVNGKHVPIDEYKKNLIQLSSLITQSGSRLLMLSILPFYVPYLLSRHPASFFEPEGPEWRRQQVNRVVKEVASHQRVLYYDISALFEKVGMVGTGKYSLIRNMLNSKRTDGVHPTPDGYRFMALAIYNCIKNEGFSGGTIVCLGDSITKGDGSIDRFSYPAFLNKLLM